MRKTNVLHKKIILVGPLPPGWGGARVSFKLFYDFIMKSSKSDISHFDLPIRNARDKNPPGRVNHYKTAFKVFCCMARIPVTSSVIVFGSKNFGFTYGILLLLVSKAFRKPFYIRFFGGHPAQNSLVKFSVIRLILFKIMSFADQIVVQTHVGAREFQDYLSEKISVVVGYRPAPDLKSSQKKLSDGITRFVYVGGITLEKGVHHLLAAFRAIGRDTSKIELHLYGAGSKEIVEKMKDDIKVFYHGTVNNDCIRAALKLYDCFVFPSTHTSEGHPGVLIEALMAGLPVIVSDLSGPKEVVQDRVNGLIFKVGDIEKLASTMQELVENESLRNRLSKGALESSKNFQAELVLPKLAASVGITE